jgi:hypothetical protein
MMVKIILEIWLCMKITDDRLKRRMLIMLF